MAFTKEKNIDQYIANLEMNGLKGRVLHKPSKNPKRKSDILFVYGHHSSLERWWGVIQDLSQYGSVTVPDLPGFGGMDSFYSIGQKPTLDNLADYLAAFIKMRYKRKKVVIIGLSFGFAIATKMLQKYPELVKKVDLLVSVVGFSHYSDFSFSKKRLFMYKLASKFFSYRLPAIFFRKITLSSPVLKLAYAKTHNAKHKFKYVKNNQDLKKMIDFEIKLWHSNDVRTHMYTSNQFLKINNCNQTIDLPLSHVYTKHDNYFSKQIVVEHLRVIFNRVDPIESKLANHSPSVIATVKAAKPLIPNQLRDILDR